MNLYSAIIKVCLQLRIFPKKKFIDSKSIFLNLRILIKYFIIRKCFHKSTWNLYTKAFVVVDDSLFVIYTSSILEPLSFLQNEIPKKLYNENYTLNPRIIGIFKKYFLTKRTSVPKQPPSAVNCTQYIHYLNII